MSNVKFVFLVVTPLLKPAIPNPPSDKPKVFVADHPFIAVIKYESVILFASKLMKF